MFYSDQAHEKAYSTEQTSNASGVCKETVNNILKKYAEECIESVVTLKRSINSDNAKRKLDGRAEEIIIKFYK